jgi:hypothetical protein
MRSSFAFSFTSPVRKESDDMPDDPLRAHIRDIGSMATSMMRAIQDLRVAALRGIQRTHNNPALIELARANAIERIDESLDKAGLMFTVALRAFDQIPVTEKRKKALLVHRETLIGAPRFLDRIREAARGPDLLEKRSRVDRACGAAIEEFLKLQKA